jgi:acetoin utilization protein AcuB
VNPREVTVAEAYSQEIYKVAPSALLTEVAKEMAHHKYGSALVLDNQKLVGIFTWVDALNGLAEVLDSKIKH